MKYKYVLYQQLILFCFLLKIVHILSNEAYETTVPFIKSTDGFVEVYTDGACSKNGKVGAQAGVGIWFNHNHELNLSGRLRNSSTNNNAEILAATLAIQLAHKAGVKKLRIYTDSQFVINSITKWIKKWRKNNWKLHNGAPVKNKNAFQLLHTSIKLLDSIDWVYVKAHNQYLGNEMADKLAKEGVFGKFIELTV